MEKISRSPSLGEQAENIRGLDGNARHIIRARICQPDSLVYLENRQIFIFSNSSLNLCYQTRMN